VTPAVCADADLLVAPWALSNVVSGTPRLFKPYVVSAKFAAALRNWHWEHKRQAKSPSGINLSTVTTHYPNKTDMIQDRPVSDSGNNFGRYARAGLMDEYRSDVFNEALYGIPLRHWQSFFKALTETNSPDQIARRLSAIAEDAANMRPSMTVEQAAEIRDSLRQLFEAGTRAGS
jgi:hypothetical protein